MCICCRVTNKNEDLFHGNMAPAIIDERDPLDKTLQGFCLCDGSQRCGRKATSDTTADSSEPQNNILLGVPRNYFHNRRRKRQANRPGQEVQARNSRTYPTDYEYVDT